MKILIAGLPDQTKNYEKALALCHVSFDVNLSFTQLSSYDKLLLPGGGDICPDRFGQADHGSLSVNKELDDAQFVLLDAFVQAGKPVLGICRGMQVINVYFGGDLIQDLPVKHTHQYTDRDQVHEVKTAHGSLMHRLYQDSCLVNSAHHQGCGKIGQALRITQTAPDGVVEALEHDTRPILGVQWHPERTDLVSYHTKIADGGRLIRYFAERL